MSNERVCFRAAVLITLSVARVGEHMLIFRTFNSRRSAWGQEESRVHYGAALCRRSNYFT